MDYISSAITFKRFMTEKGRSLLNLQALLVLLFWTLLSITPLPGQSWEIYNTTNSLLPHDNVLSLAVTDDGIKWIGTQSGLARYDGSDWTVFTTEDSGLPGNLVRCIEIDLSGEIWIGTNNGLAHYDGIGQGQDGSGNWIGWTVYNMNNSGLPRNVVESLAIDSTNSIWIGTLGGGGLARFNRVSWSVFTSGNSELPNNFIYALTIDEEDQLWIGTNFGLASYDQLNWNVYNTSNSQLPDNAIRSLTMGSGNLIHIGTENGGLALLDGVFWTVYDQSNSQLPENNIPALFVKESGVIWLGTSLSGLVRKNNASWSTYTVLNSDLPGNEINTITVEDEYLKWIGTSEGLASFDLISVTGIVIDPDSLVLDVGDTYQLTAEIIPENASYQGYNWFSGDDDLATVDSEGIVTAHNSGSLLIHAVTEDGAYMATCQVEVTGTVASPEFLPPAGEYNTAIEVSITTATEGALIRYTLDGTEPDETSSLYIEPITIDSTTTISARAYREYWEASVIVEAEYTIVSSAGDENNHSQLACRVFPNPIYIRNGVRAGGKLTFMIDLPSSLLADLEIFDLRGRRIISVKKDNLPAGKQIIELPFTDFADRSFPSGIYFYRFQTMQEVVMGKFTVIR